MNKAEIAEFFRLLADRIPEPETELEYGNEYTLLVAVVLSAQATDVGVNLATRDLFKAVTTPEQMIALGEEKLRQHIKTIGLFNTKAKNVIALSRALVEQHGGQVPADRDALEQLPGVGRKTANVVMNCAFGAETFAVDTHVFRVGNRTGLAPGKTPAQVEAKLDKRVPQPYRRHAHHWLILHGRYVCKARRPECWRCVVRDLCRYKPKTLRSSEEEAQALVRAKVGRLSEGGSHEGLPSRPCWWRRVCNRQCDAARQANQRALSPPPASPRIASNQPHPQHPRARRADDRFLHERRQGDAEHPALRMRACLRGALRVRDVALAALLGGHDHRPPVGRRPRRSCRLSSSSQSSFRK